MSNSVLVFGDRHEPAEQQRFLRHFQFLSVGPDGEPEGTMQVPSNKSEDLKLMYLSLEGSKRIKRGRTRFLTLIRSRAEEFSKRLLRPFRISMLLLRNKSQAVVFLSSRIAFTGFISALVCRKRVLFLESIPWQSVRRSSRSILIQPLLFLRDIFAIYSCEVVIVRTAHVKESLTLMLPFLGKRLHQLPLSIDRSALEESKKMRPEQRESFLEKYNVPENSFIILCDAETASRAEVTFSVRVLHSLENPKAVLLILGSADKNYFILPLLIALDLHDRVLFVDDWKTEHLSFGSAHVYLGISSQIALSESLVTAYEEGVPVLVQDIPEMREVVADDRLRFRQGNVEECAKRLGEIISSRSLYGDLEAISRKQAERYDFSWAERFVEIARLK